MGYRVQGTAQTFNCGLKSAVPVRLNGVSQDGAGWESPQEEVTPRTAEGGRNNLVTKAIRVVLRSLWWVEGRWQL